MHAPRLIVCSRSKTALPHGRGSVPYGAADEREARRQCLAARLNGCTEDQEKIGWREDLGDAAAGRYSLPGSDHNHSCGGGFDFLCSASHDRVSNAPRRQIAKPVTAD